MRKLQTGFTLIEAVMVIAITGIIAAVVAVFIQAPVQGYFDSARRAELTDIADTAVRRISRDVHLALPNSVRLATPQVMEFLQTRTGGRYRVDGGDPLNFAQANPADTTFDVLGPAVTMATGDQIVIFNLGIPGADAYAGNNRRAYNGAVGAVTNIAITPAALPFPLNSPGRRFQVVDTPVTYICDVAAGTLTRFWGYAITAAQANPPVGGNNALLARNVSACNFTYTPGITARSGLVSMQLAITQNNETVSLYHAVHVSNAP